MDSELARLWTSGSDEAREERLLSFRAKEGRLLCLIGCTVEVVEYKNSSTNTSKQPAAHKKFSHRHQWSNLPGHPEESMNTESEINGEGPTDTVGCNGPTPKHQVAFDEGFGLLTMSSGDEKILGKVFRMFSCTFPKGIRTFCCTLLPVLQWLPQYNLQENFISDIIGGLTVGIMNLPQGLAYASLVGLEPIHGLYTSFFPALFYMFFASSRLSSIGTSAVISLMVGRVNIRVANQINNQGSLLFDHNSTTTQMPVLPVVRRVDVAMTLTLTVGLVQIGVALLRLDLLTTYMSDQVIRGFTTGAALHVLVSQLDKILGVKLSRHEGFLRLFKTLRDLVVELPYANPATALTSSITLIALYFCKNEISVCVKKKYCRFPIPFDLIVVVVGISLSYLLNMETKYHMKVVGSIPLGLPAPSFPNIAIMPYVVTDAIVLAVIILAVAVSMGNLFAKKCHHSFDVRQEFFAIGITECACSLFPCWTASIALARSLINESAGTKTQLSTIFSSLLILLVIYVLSPLMRLLPMCFLACIVIVALRGMFMQFRDLKHLWHVSKYDFAVWIIAFLFTILFDVVQGLVAGIIFALFTIIIRTQRQKTTVLGRLCRDNFAVYYRPLHRYRDARTMNAVICIQIDGPILFTNANSVKKSCFTTLQRQSENCKDARTQRSDSTASEEQTGSDNLQLDSTDSDGAAVDYQRFGTSPNTGASAFGVKYIIVDLVAVTYIDSTGARTLMEIYNEMTKSNVIPLFCNASYTVLHTISKCGHDGKPPPTAFYPSVEDARQTICMLAPSPNPSFNSQESGCRANE